MEISYFLKNPKGEVSPIYINIFYNGIRVRKSINQKVGTSNWNHQKQKVKYQATNSVELNSILSTIEATVGKEISNLEISNEEITEENLKFILLKQLGDKKGNKYKTLVDLFNGYIDEHIALRDLSDSTMNKFVSARNHLIDFQSKKKKSLKAQDVKYKMIVDLIYFLSEKGLANQSMVTYFKKY